VFVRYTVNVEAILKDPDMKKAAMNQALGTTTEIYGATVRDATPREELPAPEEPQEAEEPPEESNPFDEDKEAALDEEEKVRVELEQWLLSDVLTEKLKGYIRWVLDADKPLESVNQKLPKGREKPYSSTVEMFQDFIARCKAKEEGGAS